MNQTYTDELGAVRAGRAALRITIEELAERAAVNPGFLRRIEAGQAVAAGPALAAVLSRLSQDADDAATVLVTVARACLDQHAHLFPSSDKTSTGPAPEPFPTPVPDTVSGGG